ncbi:MAG: ribulose-phosphate 3-epimerase [Bacilli bacterium]|nr:ribulose-phosphate 3-epimerase [Bacilli bacterium]
MKYLSTSILGFKENAKENIKKIDSLNTDYLHIDIMDGIFVPNKTWSIEETKTLVESHTKPLDVHLMVSDIKKYIDDFSTLNPTYITFHFEATENPKEIIEYIKSKNIKVGISIKPRTTVEDLIPYLNLVDLILIMSVEPGKGGQEYLTSANEKIDELELLRNAYRYNYLIEVDGGINNNTIKECLNADMFVVGSYITSSEDFEEKINEIKSNF